ncbi:MAG: succinate dehydrogenase cytochrome b subunit [Kiritimatiellia bacterium]
MSGLVRTLMWVRGYLTSSIGKKQVLGVVGAGLVMFLAGHMVGNLPLLNPDVAASQAAYNAYCRMLTGLKPMIWFVEAGLVSILLLHAGLALILKLGNSQARGGRYAVVRRKGDASFATYTMFASGVIILVFLVQHLLFFKFGAWYLYQNAAGEIIRDMWLTTALTFQNPVWTAAYSVALLVAGAHLVHAIPSLFRTFGLVHTRWTPLFNLFGRCAAAAIVGGFVVTAIGTCALMHTDKGERQIKKALADQPRLEKVMTVQSAAKGVQK